jgi:hypothetical protein
VLTQLLKSYFEFKPGWRPDFSYQSAQTNLRDEAYCPAKTTEEAEELFEYQFRMRLFWIECSHFILPLFFCGELECISIEKKMKIEHCTKTLSILKLTSANCYSIIETWYWKNISSKNFTSLKSNDDRPAIFWAWTVDWLLLTLIVLTPFVF